MPYHLTVLSYDTLNREMSLSSEPVCVFATTDPFLGRVDAVPSKAEQLANISARTFWSLPSPWLWSHFSSRLSRQPLLLCPLCSLAIHHSPRPSSPAIPPALLLFPGCQWGARCARCQLGTYSRGLEKPGQGSPPARCHLRCSVLPVLSPHPSPAALQRAEIAPKHVLPSGERCQGQQPRALPAPGAPAGTGSSRGSSPAPCRDTAWF